MPRGFVDSAKSAGGTPYDFAEQEPRAARMHGMQPGRDGDHSHFQSSYDQEHGSEYWTTDGGARMMGAPQGRRGRNRRASCSALITSTILLPIFSELQAEASPARSILHHATGGWQVPPQLTESRIFAAVGSLASGMLGRIRTNPGSTLRERRLLPLINLLPRRSASGGRRSCMSASRMQ